MYLHRLILSLASVCWVSAGQVCNSSEYDRAYAALFQELGLFNDNSLMKHIRPQPEDVIMVYIILYVTSITDVNEKAQSITTQVQMYTWWTNMKLQWDASKYCGIQILTTQRDLIWTPDIAVRESIKTEFAATESPYVSASCYGSIDMMDILSLTTACSMDLYRFPFDTQICNLTFQSLIYRDHELKIYGFSDSTSAYKQKSFKIPGEWQLLDIYYTNNDRGKMIYQLTISRKPLVYVINLIFPVFCFLVLDVASFFINAAEADKLSFNVTLLLSISVLLQVLNDRLTATTSDIPLIGVYCGVIFTLIGFSILETILVNILIAKGEKAKSVTPEETRAAETGQELIM